MRGVVFKTVFIFCLCALFVPACTNEEEEVRSAASRFWKSVLEGNFDSAYKMLSRQSRILMPRSEFENEFSFGTYKSWNSRALQKAWLAACKFTIEDVEQRSDQGRVTITFRVPDMEALSRRISAEAEREGMIRKFAGDEQKLESWFAKRMTEELKNTRFTRMRIDNETYLVREAGEWKIFYQPE